MLIPGPKSIVYEQGTFTSEDIHRDVTDKPITIIEAKKTLNRTVIGQVQFAEYIVSQLFSPSHIKSVALVHEGNADLEAYCYDNGISVEKITVESPPTREAKSSTSQHRTDERQEPNTANKRAFLKGWNDAVNGVLYESVKTKKTHANMGNLFGWIYGDTSQEFKVETWERYIANYHFSFNEEN